MQDIILDGLFSILKILIIIVPLLLSIAYMTLAERKIMGSMQRRLGPNRVGVLGLLQPFSDALKLVVKENPLPSASARGLFIFTPILSLSLSLMGWAIIPFGYGLSLLAPLEHMSILYFLAISSLGVLAVLFGGWSGNSKYALLGSLRSTAQMISYEVAISLIILVIPLISWQSSLDFISIIENQYAIWYFIPLLPLSGIFFICALAETNRAPFDLPEAESELVAGFFTEHSSLSFAFFFLAEYGSIILISTVTIIFFFGGYTLPSSDDYAFLQPVIIGLKSSIIIFSFIWIRASYPRLRYDQLMTFCWCNLLPLTLSFFIFIPSILILFTSIFFI